MSTVRCNDGGHTTEPLEPAVLDWLYENVNGAPSPREAFDSVMRGIDAAAPGWLHMLFLGGLMPSFESVRCPCAVDEARVVASLLSAFHHRGALFLGPMVVLDVPLLPGRSLGCIVALDVLERDCREPPTRPRDRCLGSIRGWMGIVGNTMSPRVMRRVSSRYVGDPIEYHFQRALRSRGVCLPVGTSCESVGSACGQACLVDAKRCVTALASLCPTTVTSLLRCGVCHAFFHAHRHVATGIVPYTPFHEDFDEH